MKPLACITDDLSESSLDVHVHIFKCYLPMEFTGVDLCEHLIETSVNVLQIIAAQNAAGR
jgi:hypothetical protein